MARFKKAPANTRPLVHLTPEQGARERSIRPLRRAEDRAFVEGKRDRPEAIWVVHSLLLVGAHPTREEVAAAIMDSSVPCGELYDLLQ